MGCTDPPGGFKSLIEQTQINCSTFTGGVRQQKACESTALQQGGSIAALQQGIAGVGVPDLKPFFQIHHV